MEFRRIENTLAVCRAHLEALDTAVPNRAEIEHHLVASAVLTIISDYEEYIEETFSRRAEQSGDWHVASYVRSQVTERFRSPDLGKITETLGKFGQDYRDQFSTRVLNTEAHASWDNIMTARHAIVHKRGIMNLTLRELRDAYEKSRKVLEALVATLGLPGGAG